MPTSGLPNRPANSPASRAAAALIFTAIAAALLGHFGQLAALLQLLPRAWQQSNVQLHVRMAWAAIHIAIYALVPLLLAKSCGLTLHDLGLRFGASRGQWQLALAVALVALPIILLASRTALFQRAYPIYRPAPSGTVLEECIWLLLLGSYLFSIELYFRGFLLGMLTPAMGSQALFVALVPYVATHPFLPEALGAIPVGILLGLLRLRAGSLWPGYLAHLLVALELEGIGLLRHSLPV